MQSLTFLNEQFTLLASGALCHAKSKTLLVADTHIGKGIQLQDTGTPLIKNIDDATLNQLHEDVHKTQTKSLIILGDFIHGQSNHLSNHLISIGNELNTWPCNISITLGNHDRCLPTYHNALPSIILTTYCYVASILCCHEPHPMEPCICGHVHPGIRIGFGKLKRRKKALIRVKNTLILPAYGRFTGTNPNTPHPCESWLLP